MKIIIGVLTYVLISKINCAYSGSSVEEIFQWKKVIFENLPKSENAWIGPYPYYNPENVAVNGFTYHPASGLFVATFPRLRPGVPISMGAFCVDEYKFGSSPSFWAFPNNQMNLLHDSDFAGDEGQSRNSWQSHNKHNTGHYLHHTAKRPQINEKPSTTDPRIISLFHIHADEKCNRAFFMDQGNLVYNQSTTYTITNPTLWVIDLPVNGCKTRNFPIIRRRELPDKINAIAPGGYVHLTFDYQSKDSCDDLFVYIANTFYNILVVFDYKNDEFWYFEHETFKAVISESQFVFDKTFKYEWPLGLHTIALGHQNENGDRMAYYSSAAGTGQYRVSTKILKNRNKSPNNFNTDDFRIMGYRACNHQPFTSAIDLTHGVMLTTATQANEITCWNINKPYNPNYIDVVSKSYKYNFPTQAFIDSRGYFWFGSTPDPILYASNYSLDLTQVISRTFRIKVSDAIQGTVCENEE